MSLDFNYFACFSKQIGIGVELLNEKNNFNLWQVTVKDIIVQQGLIDTLYGKSKKLVIMYADEEASRLLSI